MRVSVPGRVNTGLYDVIALVSEIYLDLVNRLLQINLCAVYLLGCAGYIVILVNAELTFCQPVITGSGSLIGEFTGYVAALLSVASDHHPYLRCQVVGIVNAHERNICLDRFVGYDLETFGKVIDKELHVDLTRSLCPSLVIAPCHETDSVLLLTGKVIKPELIKGIGNAVQLSRSHDVSGTVCHYQIDRILADRTVGIVNSDTKERKEARRRIVRLKIDLCTLAVCPEGGP